VKAKKTSLTGDQIKQPKGGELRLGLKTATGLRAGNLKTQSDASNHVFKDQQDGVGN
jgi:hypothetical protein